MSKSPPGARVISYKNMRAICRATGSPMSVRRERALANVDATRQRILPSAGARPSHARYLVIATAYLVAYLAINVITNSRQFHESGITLWSPDNGLSLLLLIESTYFAPIVLLASILTDVFVNNVRHSLYIVVASELVLTWGYLLIAIVLRDVFSFRHASDDLQKYDRAPRGGARQRRRDRNPILRCVVFYRRHSREADL